MAVGPDGFVVKIAGTRTPIVYFAWFLSQRLNDVPVVDQTGLDGFYDFTLEWLQELPAGFAERRGAAPPAALPAVDNAPAGPTLATALREQLGLKLEKRKAPADVFVIDRAEKPEVN